MSPVLPQPVRRSVRVYRGLLNLYPRSHRQEYGPSMVQLFRDVCLHGYRKEGTPGVIKVWLGILPDIGESAGQERYDELKRTFMHWQSQKSTIDPRYVMAMLVATVLIAFGILGKAVMINFGGPVLAGVAIVIAMNLAGAGIMDFVARLDGAVIMAMIFFIVASLLPLLWVPDATTWLVENPVNVAFIIILAAFAYLRNHQRWTIYAVTLILSAAQIGVSLI